MFDKTEHVVRGWTREEVEEKASNFIYMRDEVHDEEWKLDGDVEKQGSSSLLFKPYLQRLVRVEDDL